MSPALSTYEQHFDLMAQKLTEITLNRIKNPDSPYQQIGVPMEFIPGGSLPLQRCNSVTKYISANCNQFKRKSKYFISLQREIGLRTNLRIENIGLFKFSFIILSRTDA